MTMQQNSELLEQIDAWLKKIELIRNSFMSSSQDQGLRESA
jgi:hypothetical protein